MIEAMPAGVSLELTDCARGVEELLENLDPVTDYLGNQHTWITTTNSGGLYQLAKKESSDGTTSYSLMQVSHPDSSGGVVSHDYSWSQDAGEYIYVKYQESEAISVHRGASDAYRREALQETHIKNSMPDIISVFFNTERVDCIHNGVHAITD